MSGQATPRASIQDNPIVLSPTPAYLQDKSPTPSEQLHSESGNEPEYNEYDFAPGAPSDISSLIGDNDAEREPRDQDTVAQGEDFSMIFANSIPSMMGHTSMHVPGSDDVGEETGLIINQTMESLRRSGALRVDDDDDEEVEAEEAEDNTVRVPTEQEALTHRGLDQEEAQPEQEAETHIKSIVDFDNDVDKSPVALPSLPRPILSSQSLAPEQTSPNRSNQSPGRTRSSPRRKSIPLGRKLFENKAKQLELETSKMGISQPDDSFSSIPSRILDAATPHAKASRRSSMANEEASAVYEDEFSEIPEAYLEAATPGKANLPQVDEDNEEAADVIGGEIQDEMEDFEDDVEISQGDQAEEQEAAEEEA
ncbi:hypothetical protein CH063_15572, partial [Colletotrichum higginsianum]